MTTVTITVNFPEVTKAKMDKLLGKLARFAVEKAQELSAIRFSNNRAFQTAYARGLALNNPKVITFPGPVVTLVAPPKGKGIDPNLLENGCSPWSIRDALLNSSKAKQGAHGKYMNVPFRHGEPGSSGVNFPTMPKPVYTAFQKTSVAASEQRKVQGVERVGKGKFTAALVDMPEANKSGHARSIYQDMAKMTKQYAAAKGNQYMTFRRVSSNIQTETEEGKPRLEMGWLHPGFKPAKIFEAVVPYVEKEGRRMVKDAFSIGVK